MRWNHTRRRLLLVIVATAITVAFFWPPYRDALRRINESLLTNISSDGAQAADDEPMWRECPGRPILPSDGACGPWHYGTPPWSDFGQDAEDKPMWRECPGRPLPSDGKCGPWHYDNALPWEGR